MEESGQAFHDNQDTDCHTGPGCEDDVDQRTCREVVKLNSACSALRNLSLLCTSHPRSTIGIERDLHDHVPENLGELRMGQREGPET